MASGVIDGFFRKVRPGQPLRSLANVENLNKVANILNDITGEGCWIEKPLNGDPWIIHVSDDTSGEKPLVRRRRFDCQVDSVNGTTYSTSNDAIFPNRVTIRVNGITVNVDGTQPGSWANAAGLKYLFVIQRFNVYNLDAENQYAADPYYTYCTDTTGLGYDFAVIAKIPWCRVEIPVVGDPPVVKNLLEGPVNIYCYRGDSTTRAFAETPANPERQKPRSKTVDNANGGALPVKVRNIDAAADGYYNAYPNGRYHIVTSQGVDTVEWYTPHEPEQSKNDAKLLLLRYLWPQNNIPHGLPYWCTVAQFLHNSESWTEDYINETLEDDKSWLISILSPWARDIWSEKPGPYEPVLESEIEEGVEVLAAIKNSDGEWVSILDIVVMQDELDVTLEDYGDISDRVDSVESQAQACVDEAEDAEDTADAAAQTIANFTDYSQNVGLVDGEASVISARVSGLTTDFGDLNTRITALEQRI